ncbi:MAG: amidohydrolase family protein [Gemmatimonadetes bacterium]|nr:amidohydrolase family protein [Gemmatimonadota bacterium]
MMRQALVVATLAIFALIGGPPPAAAQVTPAPPLEIFHGFTLIDGTGRAPIADAAISVRGNEIVTVWSRRELLSGPSAPRDAIVINLGGGYVIPGLIDAHVHLSTSPNREAAEAELYRLLYAGVTAVRDMAGDGRALASLARDSRLGEIDAPDVYYSALMAGPQFMTDPRPQAAAAGAVAGQVPWLQAITPQSDIPLAVAMAKGTYATGIKIHADLAAAEVARITQEAHRQGMQVWAHSMVVPARPLEVIQSDVDVVSHVCDIAWEAMNTVPPRYHHDMTPQYGSFTAGSAVFTQLFGEMVSRGTILDATLATYVRQDASRDLLPYDLPGGCDIAFARSLVRRANELGVAIAAGSDFTSHPDDPFPALYEELEELVIGGGLSPMDAIVAATSTAARSIGIEATQGTLAHGRPVSFVLLREDPLVDIRALRSVQSVWKNAERFDRTDYRSRFPRDDVAETRPVAGGGAASTQALLDAWLAMWRPYDLDQVAALFVNDDALSYFPSDREGLIQGYAAVRGYLEGLGFVSGGFQPESEMWLEEVTVSDFGESAVVGAVWYFGNRLNRRAAGRGPLTMVLARVGEGWRISHVNFGNYQPER